MSGRDECRQQVRLSPSRASDRRGATSRQTGKCWDSSDRPHTRSNLGAAAIQYAISDAGIHAIKTGRLHIRQPPKAGR